MSERGAGDSGFGSTSVGRRDFVRSAGASAAALALGGLLETVEAAKPSQPPGRVKTFIDEIKRARLFDLASVWDETSPVASVNPSYSFELVATHGNTIGTFGDGGQLSFTAEVQHWSGQHGAPSIDALAHIGHSGLLFGGVDAIQATSNPLGVGRSGVGANLDIAHYPTRLLVNRGVLLDVGRLVNGDLAPLPPGFEVTAQHLRDAARAQRARLEPGDTILIRTGWGQHFAGNPALYAGGASPGPGVDGARFLVAAGARVVGDDTLTFEKRPPIAFPPETPLFQVFPVHMFLIPDNGIFIIENYYLEELAQERVYEFLLVVPPLKIRGGTGSALRSFALAP